MSEKLNKAFRQMRRKGLIALQNFSCCSSCAGSEIAVIAKHMDDEGNAPKGTCFYHKQDGAYKKQGKPFYLSFGTISYYGNKDEPVKVYGEDTVAIGKQVAAILKANGIGYQWDEKAESRIRVMEF